MNNINLENTRIFNSVKRELTGITVCIRPLDERRHFD